MKKFTFLLSLLLASSGVTASAQDARSWTKLSADANLANAVTDLSTLTDGGTYAFYSVGQSKYITINNFDNLHFGRAASLTASNAESGLAVFKFHITKNGDKTTYTFETAIGGQYMPAAADNNNKGGATATSTPASFVIQNHTTDANPTTKTDGQFVIKNESDNLSFDMGGDDTNQFCGWQGKGDNCWYKIVPVQLSETKAYSVPYVTTDNAGNTVTYLSGRKTLTEGETFATPIVPYYYSISSDQTNYVVSSDNCKFTYKVSKTGDAPVEFSTDNNKVWYTLKTRNSEGNYLVRQADNIIRSGGNDGVSKYDATCITSLDLLDGGLWAFVEDGVAVKLLNKQNGKYLRVNGTGNQANFNGEASKFYFQKITPKDGFTADFSLQYAATSFLGDHSTYQGTPLLATYDNAEAYKDNGSAFIAKKIDLNSDADFIALAKKVVTAEIDAATASEDSSDELVAQTAAALSTAKTTVASATSYDAIVTARTAAFSYPANVDANAYYQIIAQSVNGQGVRINKTNISSESMVVNKNGVLEAGERNSRIIRRTTASDALVPQMWQLVANADGSYKIKNANTNCCIGQIQSNGTGVEMPISNEGAGDYVITKGLAVNKFLLKNGSHMLNAYQGDANTIIADYNGNNSGDTGSNWVIKKVTTVPVSITNAKYATVAFPFATKVTTNSVKAYYATGAADGMITLVEYPEGIIPANEGALLYNEAGATTANLEIVTTEKTVDGNKLTPATAKRSGFAANETYVLAKNSANEAAFLKNGLTVVPANKAYITAETIPADNNGSNVLNFNFGQVTGINGVVAADKAGVQYFDLQGRRVLYPAHGIFVTNTGKKVFVK